MQPKVSNDLTCLLLYLMFHYLQIRTVEELEEVRDSLEVQKLSSQNKLVYHHVHVFLCSGGGKVNFWFWQTSILKRVCMAL